VERARTARPAVFLTGITWALTGLTLLLAVVVIYRTWGQWWSFLLLVLPLSLAALAVSRLMKRATEQPDDPL
jgi:hypothetical protein